ncbi:hypothetical protein [Vibrio cholerae]|uniref:hypothetical protein n=1 Tax=Vibrio cholerae TaxID=666 RepID=UPI0020886081|nr:hypothetical protein [Vibrio cholerae]GIB43324.1 hypothetical protein VCSRO187_0826 [Vibrio cholerae]
MEDFEVVNQDVVTQVIHLEYFVLDDEYFLYQVLDTYLENKELISEYFSKILQSVLEGFSTRGILLCVSSSD